MKNFIQANIRAVSCTPSPAARSRVRSTSGSRITPRTPTPPSQFQFLTSTPYQYQPSRVNARRFTRPHSSPSEIEKLKEKLEEVQNENKDLKKKLELNEKEQQVSNSKLEDVEKESLKMKKKFKDLKSQVKLLERLVTRTHVAPVPQSVMETNQVTTSQAGPGTCGACGKLFRRLDQHKSRTKNPECKNN